VTSRMDHLLPSEDDVQTAMTRMSKCMAEAGFKGQVVCFHPRSPWSTSLGWLPAEGAKRPSAHDCWRAREASLAGIPLCFAHAVVMARGENFECQADRRFVEDCGA
jgi:hypothetical protein